MVSKDGIRHYTAIKSLSRLLSSKNSNTKHKQHFCMNCLQGFMQESSRDLIPMKLINTRHLVGVFTASLLTEKFLFCQEPIEAKIASKLFVITSKEKLMDCITCFLKNRWIL